MVTTGASCPWSATSHSDFLTLNNGSGRAGSSGLGFSVSANLSGSARTATATIAGITFTLTHQGSGVNAERIRQEKARADFDGDGRSDLLWQHDTGYLAAWTLAGNNTILSAVDLPYRNLDNDWRIAGTGDFNSDGSPDILWHHRTGGWVYVWYMNGFTVVGETYLSLARMPSAGWTIVGVGDFNGDRKPDIAWQHPDQGWLSVWLLNGLTVTNLPMSPNRLLDAPWQIAGVGDFNGDGSADLLWRHSQRGEMGVWIMDGLSRRDYIGLNPGTVEEQAWTIGSIADINGDGWPDLVWRHVTQGWVATWFMNGTRRVDAGSFSVIPSPSWKLVGPK
jgi:hypothetical protein